MPQAPSTAFTDAAATWNGRFAGDAYLFGTEPNTWLKGRPCKTPTIRMNARSAG